MRVLHILDSLNRAGAEMQALDICRNAAANGLDMAFAALGGGALEDDFRNSGVEFIRLQRRFPVDPFIVKELRRFIRKNEIDIVHAHQAVDGIHAYLAARGSSSKVVLSFHGAIPDLKNRLALKFLIPRVSANICCSRSLLKSLESEGIDTSSFRVIYNGVDRKRLEHSGPGLREELGVAADSLIFGMIAHFHPGIRKDHLSLCRAFVNVYPQLADAHLLIVGKAVGEEGTEKLKKCQKVCREGGVAERVHFLGERNDTAKILDAINVYVLSSLHEGLPIAVIEAMLAKKPIILSDIEPHIEISESGKYAYLFKAQDASDLAEKLLRFSTDAELRSSLAEHAFRHATSEFSIESHIQKLKNLYPEIAGKRL
jgi:glycosyltransferase involved in cell wall biosynthesis